MKKMKIRLLALAAALALLLAGCAPRGGETPSAPPSSPEEPPALSGPGAEEEPAEPVYYDADFYARPAWNAAGTGTAIKNGAALTWVGLDNEVLRAAAFGDPAAGPGLSPEDITLTIGEGWVLRTVPGTRAALREGKWTLLNAALYDLDGTLLRAFPDASPEEVEAATGDYEKQSAYVNAYPLGSGHIALETGAMLLLYDIAADARSLVDDYRDVRWQGFTVYDAGAYGIYQCWPFGESLYYMASIDPPPGEPRRVLYRLDTAGERELFCDDTGFFRYKPVEGGLYGFREWNNGIFTDEGYEWGIEAWFLPDGGEWRLVAKDNTASGDALPLDASHYDYIWMDKRDGEAWPSFRRHDLATGEEISFSPRDYDGRKLYDGGYGFGLYCTRAVEGGVQFVYVVSDVAETADGDLMEKRECWLYDTREDAPRRLDRLDGASIWGINPQGTHAIEGGGPPWRVVPLE